MEVVAKKTKTKKEKVVELKKDLYKSFTPAGNFIFFKVPDIPEKSPAGLTLPAAEMEELRRKVLESGIPILEVGNLCKEIDTSCRICIRPSANVATFSIEGEDYGCVGEHDLIGWFKEKK